MLPELSAFLASWTQDPNGMKPVFTAMCEYLESLDNIALEYKGRPGVSHSLRAKHAAQKNRDLFVLVDIIDDIPDERWLSVCFYADLVTDPEERGDVVPGGLMGADACCFDIDSTDNDIQTYMISRLKEAAVASSNG